MCRRVPRAPRLHTSAPSPGEGRLTNFPTRLSSARRKPGFVFLVVGGTSALSASAATAPGVALPAAIPRQLLPTLPCLPHPCSRGGRPAYVCCNGMGRTDPAPGRRMPRSTAKAHGRAGDRHSCDQRSARVRAVTARIFPQGRLRSCGTPPAAPPSPTMKRGAMAQLASPRLFPG